MVKFLFATTLILASASLLLTVSAHRARVEKHSRNNNNNNNEQPLTEERVHEIVQEELVQYNLTRPRPDADVRPPRVQLPPKLNVTHSRQQQKVRLWDFDGNEFEIFNRANAYRAAASNIPETMCTGADLSYAAKTNQDALIKAHTALRAQLNNCNWKLPKPSTPLAACTASSFMAQKADEWTQKLKQNNACNMNHSSPGDRTHTFKLDNGAQVTNGYVGENLAWRSVCMDQTDQNRFNQYRKQYCNSGWLYNDSSYAWWNEVGSYSGANGGNFVSQDRVDQLNRNGKTQVGHWTQMAWQGSTVIAGAAAECSTLSTQTFTCWPAGASGCGADGKMNVMARCYSWIVTGRYYKGGNYNGETPYKSSGELCNPSSSSSGKK